MLNFFFTRAFFAAIKDKNGQHENTNLPPRFTRNFLTCIYILHIRGAASRRRCRAKRRPCQQRQRSRSRRQKTVPWTDSRFLSSFQLTFLYLAYGGILLLILFRNDRHESSAGAFFAAIGRHSYSIYLWHFPLTIWCSVIGSRLLPGGWGDLTHLTVYALLSLAVGVLFSKVIEQPFLAERDRLYPSRSGPITTGTSEEIVQEVPAGLAMAEVDAG